VAQANTYELSGHQIHVSYTTEHPGPVSPKLKPPFVTYRDSTRSLSFDGDQVQSIDTEAGRLISVVIVQTVDLGDTTFSFLLPNVNLADHGTNSAPVHTVGITAMHRTSLAPPFGHGQTDTYSTVALAGTATFIVLL